MSEIASGEILHALAELSAIYPGMRFGQLVAFVATLASDDVPLSPADVDDAAFLAAARDHVRTRSATHAAGRNGADVPLPQVHKELFAALAGLTSALPGMRFGELVTAATARTGASIYDVEDEAFLAAVREHARQPRTPLPT